jgi:hypothetical protein
MHYKQGAREKPCIFEREFVSGRRQLTAYPHREK